MATYIRSEKELLDKATARMKSEQARLARIADMENTRFMTSEEEEDDLPGYVDILKKSPNNPFKPTIDYNIPPPPNYVGGGVHSEIFNPNLTYGQLAAQYNQNVHVAANLNPYTATIVDWEAEIAQTQADIPF